MFILFVFWFCYYGLSFVWTFSWLDIYSEGWLVGFLEVCQVSLISG
ncbi:hypothetical protein DNTS_007594 [Danionella cerebrum]|uniref:Uncharacterized protein n=1 Tax=Danionella cerebrum TaxID=2873325 RepID=A0A553PYD9_9TELE|nr:hypothetical protein DNTS_007594 [Danionella translucida]